MDQRPNCETQNYRNPRRKHSRKSSWHDIWWGLPGYENISISNRSKNRQHGLYSKLKLLSIKATDRQNEKATTYGIREDTCPSYIQLRTGRHKELLWPGILLLNMQPADPGRTGPCCQFSQTWTCPPVVSRLEIEALLSLEVWLGKEGR